MAQGAPKRLAGPAFIASSATNIYNLSTSTIFTNITQIHIANVTGGPVSYSLYVGGTGGSTAGTEIGKSVSVPANSVVDYYYNSLVLKSTDFLTGLDGSGSSLVITVMGTQSVIP